MLRENLMKSNDGWNFWGCNLDELIWTLKKDKGKTIQNFKK